MKIHYSEIPKKEQDKQVKCSWKTISKDSFQMKSHDKQR
jgi:hypothetical protein